MTSSSHRRENERPAVLARRLRKQLSGDLDNIVLKALRKEPDRRYESAEQFAEDIRRHLAGLPVRAMPDSVGYRTTKFVRRHKFGVATSMLVLGLVVSGIAVTLREARIASRNQHRAERRFNDVRQLANSFLFEFDQAIKDLPGSTPARALVVKRALEYLDGLAVEARGDRSLQMEIAAAYQRVGQVEGDPMFPNLGDSKGALESSNKALAILESLSQTEPDNQQVRIALASTHQQISDILQFSGDGASAVKHSGQALRIYEDLAGTMATNQNFQVARVTQIYHYANLLSLTGRLDEAANEYRHAVLLSEQMIAANPSDHEGKVHLATSLDGLGNVLQEKGDTAGALENRRKGLSLREELSRLEPNNAHYRRQLGFSHHNLGLSLVEAGDLPSALSQFREELRLFESLRAADPRDVQSQRNVSLAHKQVGDVLMRLANPRGALGQYRSALQIDRDLSAADPRNSQAVLDLSFSESKAGSALGKLGETREALLLVKSGVERQEELLAKDPSHILLYNHLANSYTRLANCLLDSGDRKTAIEYYRKAIDARVAFSQKSPNSNSNRRLLAECYTNLAKALTPQAREDALKQYDNAIPLLDALVAADRGNAQYRISLADALSNTARLYVQMAEKDGEPSARLAYWTKARALYQRSQSLWVEVRDDGKLPATRSRAPREVGDELARCDASVAKLAQAR